MVTTLFGYEIAAYSDMWRLFLHQKEKPPKDLFQLLEFWESNKPRTPKDCIRVAAELNAGWGVDVSQCSKMIEEIFLNRYDRA